MLSTRSFFFSKAESFFFLVFGLISSSNSLSSSLNSAFLFLTLSHYKTTVSPFDEDDSVHTSSISAEE